MGKDKAESACLSDKRIKSELIDDVVTSHEELRSVYEKKMRNTEKRLKKLKDLMAQRDSGKELNDDQINAVSKYDELQLYLDSLKDMYNQSKTIMEATMTRLEHGQKREAVKIHNESASLVANIVNLQDVLRIVTNKENNYCLEEFIKLFPVLESEIALINGLERIFSPERSHFVPNERHKTFDSYCRSQTGKILRILLDEQGNVLGQPVKKSREILEKHLAASEFMRAANKSVMDKFSRTMPIASNQRGGASAFVSSNQIAATAAAVANLGRTYHSSPGGGGDVRISPVAPIEAFANCSSTASSTISQKASKEMHMLGAGGISEQQFREQSDFIARQHVVASPDSVHSSGIHNANMHKNIAFDASAVSPPLRPKAVVTHDEAFDALQRDAFKWTPSGMVAFSQGNAVVHNGMNGSERIDTSRLISNRGLDMNDENAAKLTSSMNSSGSTPAAGYAAGERQSNLPRDNMPPMQGSSNNMQPKHHTRHQNDMAHTKNSYWNGSDKQNDFPAMGASAINEPNDNDFGMWNAEGSSTNASMNSSGRAAYRNGTRGAGSRHNNNNAGSAASYDRSNGSGRSAWSSGRGGRSRASNQYRGQMYRGGSASNPMASNQYNPQNYAGNYSPNENFPKFR